MVTSQFPGLKRTEKLHAVVNQIYVKSRKQQKATNTIFFQTILNKANLSN